MTVDYFGYDPRHGHFWKSLAQQRWLDHRQVGPIDSIYAPRVGVDRRTRKDIPDDRPPAPEGVAALVYVGGWTVIAYWDRSGDGRGGSNTAFAAAGHHSFESLLASAKEQWPQIFERHARFEITLGDACAHEIEKHPCGGLACTVCGELIHTQCRLPIYHDLRKPCALCFGQRERLD